MRGVRDMLRSECCGDKAVPVLAKGEMFTVRVYRSLLISHTDGYAARNECSLDVSACDPLFSLCPDSAERWIGARQISVHVRVARRQVAMMTVIGVGTPRNRATPD